MSADRQAEPKRWRLGGDDVPARLPDALVALGDAGASPEELARLQERLRAQLAAPTSAGAPETSRDALATRASATPLWRGGVARWLAICALGAGCTFLWWLLSPHSTERARRPAPSSRDSAAPDAEHAPAPSERVLSTPAPLPEPSAPRPAASRKVAHRQQPVPAPETATPATETSPIPPARALGAPEAELALLRKAQLELQTSPRVALDTLARHEASYANGVFASEREMLRIEAELALGRRDAAIARAKRFSQRFPHSTYRARIDSLLSGKAAQKDRDTSAATDTP